MILRKKLYTSRGLIPGLFLSISTILKSFVKRQYGFEKSITINYPIDQYHYSERLFGMPELVLNEKGHSICTSCNMCVEICPTQCLNLSGSEGQEPKDFSIDISNCIFCSYCEYVCPEEAIKMGNDHILSSHMEESSVFNFKEWKAISQNNVQ